MPNFSQREHSLAGDILPSVEVNFLKNEVIVCFLFVEAILDSFFFPLFNWRRFSFHDVTTFDFGSNSLILAN